MHRCAVVAHPHHPQVIDKVILCADEEERRLLMDEVLRDPPAVSEMLRDQFANYCLRSFLLQQCHSSADSSVVVLQKNLCWSFKGSFLSLPADTRPNRPSRNRPQRPLLMERVAEALMQIRKYSGTFSKHLIAIEKFSRFQLASIPMNKQSLLT